MLEGLREVGSSVDECIYVGDSEVDAETGKRAGVRTLIVSYGFRRAEDLMASGVEISANNVKELAEKLSSLL